MRAEQITDHPLLSRDAAGRGIVGIRDHVQLSPIVMGWDTGPAWTFSAEIGWGLLGIVQLGVSRRFEGNSSDGRD